MKYNPDIHNRRSIRLRNYDYSKNGAYYLTICTINRECILSKIESKNVGAGLAPAQNKDAVVNLTKAGEIAEKNWLEIPKRYDGVITDEYIIMPNHIHGILILRATARVAPTLGQIVGSYKSKCVIEYLKCIDSNNIHTIAKIWQRNYYEHVIRDENELNRAREYIQFNPCRWEYDEENPAFLI